MIATASKTPGNETAFASPPQKSAARHDRPLNICIASPEFIGPARDGATGIAYTAMAQALAAAGHQVTCLFLGAKDPSPNVWQRWVEKYKSDGLTLVALPQINASALAAPSNLIKSYEAYHWLKKNDRFDIIHFPDRQGPGYHTLTAKHHGLAFLRATICVGLHSMTSWLKTSGQQPANEVAEVDTEFMERRAVALADAVVSPSHYLLNWISDRNWEISGNRCVPQNIQPHSTAPAAPPVASPVHHSAPPMDSHFPNLSDEAAQAAVQALSIDPANAVALKALARIHLNAGLHEAAQEACQLILKRNAQDAEALQMIEEAMIQEAMLAENLLDTNSPARVPKESPPAKPLHPFAAGLSGAFAYP